MLRIDFSDATILYLAGRLTKESGEEIERLVANRNGPHRIIVDLSEITYVDRGGEEVLQWLNNHGARFKAENSYALDFCERLQLLRY